MNWLDEKYISLISSRLQHFSRRGNIYNFRCPICGDSEYNKNKARGYFYEREGNVMFHCHNCGQTKSFANFLKYFDSLLFAEYMKEKYFEDKPKRNTNSVIIQTNIPKFKKTNKIMSQLKRITELNVDDIAKKYCIDRKIPSKYHSKLFYAPEFKKFVNSIVPNKFENVYNDEPRLVIPFYDRFGTVYGFQGRALNNSKIRYITIMLDNSKPKIYGWDTVKFNKTVYILEGPIDSMFIDNSIAMAGSDMNRARTLLELDPNHCVVIMDNEPRNKQITKRIRSEIDNGYGVFIFPKNIKEKDINDMIKNGYTQEDIMDMIRKHTYRGITAHIMLEDFIVK